MAANNNNTQSLLTSYRDRMSAAVRSARGGGGGGESRAPSSRTTDADSYVSYDTSRYDNAEQMTPTHTTDPGSASDGYGYMSDNTSSSHGRRQQRRPSSSVSSRGGEHDANLKNEYTLDEAADADVYYVKQRRGYLSITFSAVQTLVLVVMMWQCGVAPLSVNPMIGPYPDALNYWGAKNSVLIIEDGEAWRLVTPIFLHAGIVHLLCNVGVQLETGAFFEREWGSGVWLLIYLSSAIGSSILSTIYMPGSISVGSSGAVMGLFGAKLSEVFCRACESRGTRRGRIGHEVRMEQLSGVLCSVVVVALFSFIPYVDWAAHLGGLLAGMAVGLVAFSFAIGNRLWMVVWFVVGMFLTVFGLVVSLRYMYNEVEPPEEMRDVCGYYQQFFEDYECNCQLGGGGGDNGSGDGGG